MKIKLLKNISITVISIIGVIYILFLISPFIISPILNKYVPQINEEIKKSTGLISDISNIRLVTTPKFTVGVKVDKFGISTPENKTILNAENFQVKMSLLPLLAKNIRIDLIKLDNLTANLNLNKDGSFEIEKYIPAQEESQEETQQTAELPFGLKLSNHLPDIRIGKYTINFIDTQTGKIYTINGNKTDITDFVFNKNIKISSSGNVVLSGREQFKYNVKIYNKIMPENDLNEIVFNPQPEEKTDKPEMTVNILDIFKNIYNYNITADLNTDITLTQEDYTGFITLDNVSVAPNGIKLPPSNAKLVLKGNKIDIQSDLYTAQNEKSTVSGIVKTGKNTNIDLNFKSQAELSNVVRIINAIAMTFNIKDLQTLSANGKIDADFNIKSDLKKILSNGYLKIPAAKIRYGLYDITIDNIKADIALDNNNINVKNVGFSILNQPLRFFGTIKEDSTADLHLTADNLSLKGLIIACGQAALLKENQVNAGTVSLKADIIGKLDKVKPTAKIILNNLNIKNIPSATKILLPTTNIDIVTDGQSFTGTALSSNIRAINPAATVIIPKLTAKLLPDVIDIPKTPVSVEKIKFNLEGKIKNYMTDKISLDFITTGDIKSKLSGDMNAVKQTLNLVFATTENSIIIIPMFDKSKMIFNTHLNITGSVADPQVSGSFVSPALNMPEIPVTMENLNAKLHGSILNGSATVAKFTSGGIVADNINSDFSLKGENFYLKNLKGNAFDGKFSGNIIYNLSNAKTSLDFKGENMNAEKAIAGAAGIKNALSGTLGFDTKMTLTVLPDYNAMMKTVGGTLSFKISDGAFGKIGRLESFLHANNIIGNTILKTTVGSFSNIASIKDSAQFSYISGNMTFSDGWANIKNIRSTGKSLAYFITGKYNLINGTANLKILGRLDGKVVKLLGPLGELSAEKILSYIPRFGEATAKYAASMSSNPDKERVKDIPALSTNAEIYKDFKVDFNGGVESTSSVKTFKWLSKPDLSSIQQSTVTNSIKSLKTNINTDVNTTVQSVKDTVNTVKEQQAQLKESVNELKNLFKF